MTIIPTIIEGMITTITIDGYPLALRNPIPLDQLVDIVAKLEHLTSLIDFSASPKPGVKVHLPITDDWTEEHLVQLGKINAIAKTFFTILALNPKRHTLPEIAEGTSIPRNHFQGALRSICSYTSNHRLPPLYHRRVEQFPIPGKTKKRSTITYQLRRKYKEMIEAVLREVWGK